MVRGNHPVPHELIHRLPIHPIQQRDRLGRDEQSAFAASDAGITITHRGRNPLLRGIDSRNFPCALRMGTSYKALVQGDAFLAVLQYVPWLGEYSSQGVYTVSVR